MADAAQILFVPALADGRAGHARLHAWLTVPIWGLFGLLALAYAFDITLPERWLFVPFIASLIFLGLPHGAVDHVILLRLRQQPMRLLSLARVIVPYLAIAAAYLMVWLVAPLVACLSFIALTWFHWGQGDLHSLLWLTRAAHLPTRAYRAAAVFVRGGLPMLVPLLAFPEIYAEVAGATVQALHANGSAEVFLSPALQWSLGLVYATVVLGYAWTTYRVAARVHGLSAWREDMAEVLLLIVFFALVHPVLAVGLYFCCWHAARHLARLLAYENAHLNPQGQRLVRIPRPTLKHVATRLVRHAWPTTLASLGLLGALYMFVPFPPDDLTAWLGLYLVLIAVLTLPHVWVVLKMDGAEAIWRTD